MNKTAIEYLDYTWNPITGCSPCSPGCANCWAKRVAETRLRGRAGYDQGDPFKLTFHENRLDEPLRRRTPARIGVCFMGDLFHEDVPPEWIDTILNIIDDCRQHTFIILTKRSENISDKLYRVSKDAHFRTLGGGDYLPNIHLGVSISNQEEADRKIPILLNIRAAAMRWISYEPTLGPLELTRGELAAACNRLWLHDEIGFRDPRSGRTISGRGGLDWVVAGCESGHERRPAKADWFRSLRDQCVAAGVPFFLKQLEIDGKVVHMPELDGQVWSQLPEDWA